MTKDEIERALADLESNLHKFSGIEFVKRQDRILELKAKLGSLALDDIVAQLADEPEFEIGKFRQMVKDARNATKSRKVQVAAFDKSISILSKVFGLPQL